MLNIALWVFVLLLVQGILTYFQINDYRKNVREMRKQGNLFVGQVKGRIKAGSIVIMAIDDTGKIIDAKSMTGITVFHRFKPLKEVVGCNIEENQKWLNRMKNKQIIKAIEKGIEVMKTQNVSSEEVVET
ncbi:MAG: transcriptional regulator GutM [Eubacteriales bacterium]